MIHNIISAIYGITYPIRLLYTWILYWTPGLKKIPAASPPMRAALTTLLFLLIIWLAAFLRYWFSPGQGDRSTLVYVLGALVFVVLIPVVMYWIVRVWMIRPRSAFPDIDQVWEQALAECSRAGVDLMNIPLFVVLGNPDHVRANHLVRAAQSDFPVAVPDGGSPPVTVFASRDAMFLFLDGCNCLSLLAAGGGRRPVPATAPAGAGASPAPLAAGMATLDPFAARPAVSVPPDSESAGRATGTGTIALPQGAEAGDWLARVRSAGGHVDQPESSGSSAVQLTSQDAWDREQRLRHTLGLVRRSRRNLCPINGILSLIPFELVESSPGAVQTAAQKDLAILREETLVRCPSTVVVTGLEKEDGFLELIRRVGQERAVENRFGKGCEVWTSPEQNRLSAVAVHATGAFEDWIYMLFQEPDSLKHRGNHKLFRLLGRIRGRFAENLRAVLGRGFGFDPQTEPGLAPLQFLFGGCYFAAAGGRPGQQAFMKGVLQKMLQQEGELEWVPEARRRDDWLQLAASLIALLGVAALAAIGVMIWYKYREGTPPA